MLIERLHNSKTGNVDKRKRKYLQRQDECLEKPFQDGRSKTAIYKNIK